MCKVIFRGNDVEGGLVDIIKTSAPEKLVSVTSNIISSECKNLCKRNSNSVLREKTRSGIVNFSWDEFHKELHLRAPNLLHVVSATVTDVPQSLSPEEPYETYSLLHCCCIAREVKRNDSSPVPYRLHNASWWMYTKGRYIQSGYARQISRSFWPHHHSHEGLILHVITLT